MNFALILSVGRSHLKYRGPDRRTHVWPWQDLELILPGIGILFLYGSSDGAAPVGTKSGIWRRPGPGKMVSLDGQRTEHRLSKMALIAPSPIRSTTKPVGLAARV
ncbi:MAG TPA: hypothetical protein VLJ11_15800 [Bryobacteraceae bacterium]|nr:hypothetical protein [Bryobacteraceae bacterium]